MKSNAFIFLAALWALGFADSARGTVIRVTDDLTLLPVRGAEIFLTDKPGAEDSKKLGTIGARPYEFELPGADVESGKKLEIRADGYEPCVIDPATHKTIFDVALRRLIPFEGVAISPTGQLAGGAHCYLCLDTDRIIFSPFRAFLAPGRAMIGDQELDTTRGDGAFSLAREPGAQCIFILHDLGHALVPLQGWTNGARIKLQRGERLTGHLVSNGEPLANNLVKLESLASPLAKLPVTLLDFQTTTDTNGFFVFENVPLIPLSISRNVKNAAGDLVAVNIRRAIIPARGHEVVVDFDGREITGAFKIEGGAQPAVISTLLTPKAAANASTELRGFNDDWGDIFEVATKPNLTFLGGIVPPGDYRILAEVIDPASGGAPAFFRGSISVPEGMGRFDAGSIVLTNAIRKAAPSVTNHS